MQHWERICECKPIKRRLLYRHTLVELEFLVQSMDDGPEGKSKSALVQGPSSEVNAVPKKVLLLYFLVNNVTVFSAPRYHLRVGR